MGCIWFSHVLKQKSGFETISLICSEDTHKKSFNIDRRYCGKIQRRSQELFEHSIRRFGELQHLLLKSRMGKLVLCSRNSMSQIERCSMKLRCSRILLFWLIRDVICDGAT
jgi:hypothetical protein